MVDKALTTTTSLQGSSIFECKTNSVLYSYISSQVRFYSTTDCDGLLGYSMQLEETHSHGGDEVQKTNKCDYKSPKDMAWSGWS
jgi:hypothetical protein